MNKNSKKYLAGFVLIALLTLVGGVCYGSIAQAQSVDFHAMSANCDMSQTEFGKTVDQLQKNVPFNTVMPCCVDRHDNVPTTQTANVNACVKLSAIDVAVKTPNLTSFFENKLASSSDPSPPRPDQISSVLRLE